MTTITEKELAFLKAIDDSEYGDDITDAIWTWSIADNIEGIEASSLGGIAASLSKKGLIFICEEKDPEENSTNMTDEGAKLYIKKVGLKNLNKWHDEYAPVETMRPIWNARNNPEQAEEEAPETMTYGQVADALLDAKELEAHAELCLDLAKNSVNTDTFDSRTEQYVRAAQNAITARVNWLNVRNDFESGK